MSAQVDPAYIMQVGMGFWGSKTLLSAVELDLFTRLGGDGMTAEQIAEDLDLDDRAVPDFPDALVALDLLDRDDHASDAVYRNTEAGAVFLDKASPAYIGGILEMANTRLYPFWGICTEALRTGRPQNEIKHTGKPMFEELYAEAGEARAVHGRDGRDLGGQLHGARREVRLLGVQDALRRGRRDRPALDQRRRPPSAHACITFDLPAVEPIAKRTIEAAGLGDRDRPRSAATSSTIRCPTADVITMGMILHDWNLEKKMHLVEGRVRRAARGRRVRRHREPDRRRPARERLRAADVAEHADRVRRGVRLHRRRLRRMVQGGRVQGDRGLAARRSDERRHRLQVTAASGTAKAAGPHDSSRRRQAHTRITPFRREQTPVRAAVASCERLHSPASDSGTDFPTFSRTLLRACDVARRPVARQSGSRGDRAAGVSVTERSGDGKPGEDHCRPTRGGAS